MRVVFCIVVSIGVLVFFSSFAGAQCQLVTDNPAPPETISPEQLDLSSVDDVEAYLAELPDIPPIFLPLLFEQALEMARSGDYGRAAKTYQFMLKVNPKPVMLYNLSCIYSLMNKPEWATDYLEKARQYGWTEWDLVDTDTDFDNVRENEQFKAKLEELKANHDEIVQERGSLNYSTAEITIPYRLHLPDGFEPSKQYDLVIGLHGAGDNANNFTRLWGYFENPNFILAVPQAPYVSVGTWGGSGNLWFSNLGGQNPDAIKLQAECDEQYILSLISDLRNTYPVNKVFLLGFSQGAALSYVCALHNPDKIDGIIAFGGAFLQIHNEPYFTDGDIANGKPVRVFIAHGRDDRFEESAQTVYDRLSAAQYDVRLFPYDGGHYINLTALLEAQKWMSD